MSLDAYTEFAGSYATSSYQGSELPGINTAFIEDPEGYAREQLAMYMGNQVAGIFISTAHAGIFSDLADGFVDVVSAAANFLLPIESLNILYTQTSLLLSGDIDKVNVVEIMLAVMDVVVTLPIGPLPALKPLIKSIRAMTRFFGKNKKMMKSMAGFVEQMVLKVKAGKFDEVLTQVTKFGPFIIIGIEMYRDEEARKGLELMIDSIQSLDDLLVWVDFLNLPANGWDGEGEPPLLGNDELDPPATGVAYYQPYTAESMMAKASGLLVPKANALAMGLLNAVVPVAQAMKRKKSKRIARRVG